MCRMKFQERNLCVNLSAFTKCTHQSGFFENNMQLIALVLILVSCSKKKRRKRHFKRPNKLCINPYQSKNIWM